MKKDIEWLKREIPNLRGYAVLIDGEDGEWEPVTTVSIEDIYELINQLDKLEVLSQEWIDEHRESTFDLDEDFETVFIKVENLQNLLVPKQELPVIPKFVADWIEECGGYYKPSFLALGYDLYSENITYPEVDKWIADNQEVFARAWLDGYEVEEEQKYVVELPNPNNHMGRNKNVFLNKKDGEVFIDSASLFVNDITKYGQYALTEEEIKKDFEWAWAFAKPVKELEG